MLNTILRLFFLRVDLRDPALYARGEDLLIKDHDHRRQRYCKQDAGHAGDLAAEDDQDHRPDCGDTERSLEKTGLIIMPPTARIKTA